MGKRPAFQFYPSDHRAETGLQLASLAARGLWSEMLCLMHEGVPYGHLAAAEGEPIEPAQLARLVGESPAVVKRLLAELEKRNIFSRTVEGVIYSRRMVRDEHIREVRASAGRRGGNPNLVSRGEDNPSGASEVNHLPDRLLKQNGKQKTTPSSSSSSSEEEPPIGPPAGRGRKVKLPNGWQPTDRHRQFAEEHSLDCDREAEKFRDYHRANHNKFADWDAAFRNWLRKAEEYARPKGAKAKDGWDEVWEFEKEGELI